MRILSAIGFGILALAAVAQGDGKQVDHQKLIWFGYLGNIKFNERWALTVDVQERRFVDPGAQHQVVIRPFVHRTIGSGWDGAAGMSLFLNSPNDPRSTSDLVVPELRPHIEFNQKQKTRVLQVNHRYRVEARFFQNVADEDLASGYTFAAFRFRYRIGIDLPLLKAKNSDRDRLTLRASDELMVQFGANVVNNSFDQNRIAVGLMVPLGATTAIEVGYMNWFQQRVTGVDYYNRHILRFVLMHQFALQKQMPTTP